MTRPTTPSNDPTARSLAELLPLPPALAESAQQLVAAVEAQIGAFAPKMRGVNQRMPVDMLPAWAPVAAMGGDAPVRVMLSLCRSFRAAGYPDATFAGPAASPETVMESPNPKVQTDDGSRLDGWVFLHLDPSVQAAMIADDDRRAEILRLMEADCVPLPDLPADGPQFGWTLTLRLG